MQSTNGVSSRTSLLIGLQLILNELTEGYVDADQIDSMRDTPERFVKMLVEQTEGYKQDPAVILSKRFKQAFSQMIVVKDIDFTSTCEHHLLPFVGKAHVAYIPAEDGYVVGLSKIPRLVDCFARRLQLQERLTDQIAGALEEHLSPLGVGVIVSAAHQCMSCRGVRKAGASMVTSALKGAFMDDPQVRAEFLRLS